MNLFLSLLLKNTILFLYWFLTITNLQIYITVFDGERLCSPVPLLLHSPTPISHADGGTFGPRWERRRE